MKVRPSCTKTLVIKYLVENKPTLGNKSILILNNKYLNEINSEQNLHLFCIMDYIVFVIPEFE